MSIYTWEDNKLLCITILSSLYILNLPLRSFKWFYNLRVANCEFRVTVLKIKKTTLQVINLFCDLEIKLRVAGCFCELLVAFYEL